MSIYKVYSIARTWSWPVMSAPACLVIEGIPKSIEKTNKREPTLQTSSNFGLWYTPLYTIIMKQYGESEYRAPLSAVPM